MKKVVLVILCAFMAVFSADAQVVRVGILTGVGAGVGASNSKANMALHILDAAYAPAPNYDFGAYIDLGVKGSNIDDNSVDAAGGLAYGLQGKYYFLTEKFKPFVGLQAGLQTGGKASVDVDGNLSDESKIGTSFQVTPQVGFRVGPLNVWGAYRTGMGLSGNVGLVWGFGSF